MNKYDALFNYVKDGGVVGVDELAEVATQLQEGNVIDVYGLLYILGRGGGIEYKSLVEEFLNNGDSQLSGLALKILCVYWGLTSNYLDLLLSIMGEIRQDDEPQDLRRVAIMAAGNYLSQSSNPKLLQMLLDIVENEDDDPNMREWAYGSITQALGLGWVAPHLDHPEFELDDLNKREILQAAQERLLRELESTS
jgi:hypothetical protein